MAEFKRIVPVLKVSDMQKSVDFYTGVLGFSVAWRAANDGGGENCMLQAGAADLLLSTGALSATGRSSPARCTSTWPGRRSSSGGSGAGSRSSGPWRRWTTD